MDLLFRNDFLHVCPFGVLPANVSMTSRSPDSLNFNKNYNIYNKFNYNLSLKAYECCDIIIDIYLEYKYKCILIIITK